MREVGVLQPIVVTESRQRLGADRRGATMAGREASRPGRHPGGDSRGDRLSRRWSRLLSRTCSVRI